MLEEVEGIGGWWGVGGGKLGGTRGWEEGELSWEWVGRAEVVVGNGCTV